MKNIVLLVLISLTTSLCSSAQIKSQNYSKVSDFILRNYHPDSVALAKYCRIGCIFIKFSVNVRGEITRLSFSGDADSTIFITDGLTTAVNALEQDIQLISILKKLNRTFIQPFIYNYQAGYSFPKMGSSGNPAEDRANFYQSYLMFTGNMDHITKSLFDMLNFKDGKRLNLDAIILSPIGVGSGSVE